MVVYSLPLISGIVHMDLCLWSYMNKRLYMAFKHNVVYLWCCRCGLAYDVCIDRVMYMWWFVCVMLFMVFNRWSSICFLYMVDYVWNVVDGVVYMVCYLWCCMYDIVYFVLYIWLFMYDRVCLVVYLYCFIRGRLPMVLCI